MDSFFALLEFEKTFSYPEEAGHPASKPEDPSRVKDGTTLVTWWDDNDQSTPPALESPEETYRYSTDLILSLCHLRKSAVKP